MNKREIVQAAVRDFSRLSYEAQQFVLGYMVARANCTANTAPADQPEQKSPHNAGGGLNHARLKC